MNIKKKNWFRHRKLKFIKSKFTHNSKFIWKIVYDLNRKDITILNNKIVLSMKIFNSLM